MGRMQKEHEEDKLHMDHNRYANQIKKCRLLLQRVIKDDYSPMIEHYRKWGHSRYYQVPTDSSKEWFSFVEFNDMVKSLKDKEAKDKEFKECILKDEYLKKQDMELFCKLFMKYYQGWWT